MNDKNKRNNLLKYLNTPISKEGILFIYDTHNIKYDRCNLYSDFVQSLLHLVFDTYMGHEYTNIEQQISHFKWCWTKNISNFSEEGIIFTNGKDNSLYTYYFEFMLEVYYFSTDKKELERIDKDILKLWIDILDYNKEKSNSDIDSLVEVYPLFQTTLTN